MNKSIKRLVLVSALTVTAFISNSVLADVTANVGVTSNYLWRGVTQSGDLSAISGGLDYSHESGIYVGTWTSSLSGGQYELDLYGGYSGAAKGISYDVGYIKYMYPVGPAKLDFSEVQASVGYGPVTLYVATMVGAEDSSLKKDDTYVSLSAEKEISKDYTLSGTVGQYSGKDIKAAFGDDYTNLALAISKGDIKFSIEKTNIKNDDDPRAVISWSKEI